MARPTVTNVYDNVRGQLGDAQNFWTDAKLQPHFSKAYRVLFRAMEMLGNQFVEREVYFVLPANTATLVPSTAGISDMSDPVDVGDRSNLTVKSVTGATVGSSSVTLTVTGHGRVDGDVVTVSQAGGIPDASGIWAISAPTADTITLNGCVATGSYTSGGTMVYSGEDFTPVVRVERLSIAPAVGSTRQYSWRNGAFQFHPSGSDRQVKIVYRSSGAPPSSGSAVIPYDDCEDFLATYTAGLAFGSRGASSRRVELLTEALGPAMRTDASGGLLHDLLQLSVRAMQRIPAEKRRRQPFREPRSLYPIIL